MSQGELMAAAAAPRSLAGLRVVGDGELPRRTLRIDGGFSYTRGEVLAASDSWRSDGDKGSFLLLTGRSHLFSWRQGW